MKRFRHNRVVNRALALGLSLAAASFTPAYAGGYSRQPSIEHVLIISIDGFHALDYTNCSQGISGLTAELPIARISQASARAASTT